MTSQPGILRSRARPIGLPLRGSPVLSGEGETFVVRSYFVPVDLRADWCSACPVPTPHPRRSQVGPKVVGSLGQLQPLQEGRWCVEHRIGPPGVDSVAIAGRKALMISVSGLADSSERQNAISSAMTQATE